MKRYRYVWISMVAIFALAVLLSRDTLARIAWHRYGRADIALVLNRGDAKIAMEIGNYYFAGTAGRSEYVLKRAKRSFERAVSLNSAILWGHYQIARIHFVEGNHRRALEEINRELAGNPENLRSLYVRGLIRAARGELALAESDFKNFVAWAPSEWAGYNDLAWILSKRGKHREAKTTIEKAFETASGSQANPWLWNGLGIAELNLNRGPAAAAFLRAQELAGKLTADEWRRAYPGNNPASADEGLHQFIEAIKTNIQIARAVEK